VRIVLDTNVIQEDFLMRSGRFAVLFDYAKKSESKFSLIQVVLDELVANYRRELQARLAKWVRAKAQIHGMLPETRDVRIEIDVPTAADEYRRYVLTHLGLATEDVIPHRNDHLPHLISRAIERRRPCTDRGEEIRDALLWESTLDLAAGADSVVALISRNTDQFSADKQSLHPDLVAEAAARGARIQYYPSLEEFARRHATPIAFITKEWLEAHIKADAILEGSRGIVESYIDHWFHEQGGSGATLTG
jgi:predicted nucleic acid-binding protein